jgi:hypothetical protein
MEVQAMTHGSDQSAFRVFCGVQGFTSMLVTLILSGTFCRTQRAISQQRFFATHSHSNQPLPYAAHALSSVYAHKLQRVQTHHVLA